MASLIVRSLLLALCGVGSVGVVEVTASGTRIGLACLLAAGMAALGPIGRLLDTRPEDHVPHFARRPVATPGFVDSAFRYLRARARAPRTYVEAVAVVAVVGTLMGLQAPDSRLERWLALALAVGLAAAFQWGRLEREVGLLWRLHTLRGRPWQERLEALPRLADALPRDVTAALIRHRVEKETEGQDG